MNEDFYIQLILKEVEGNITSEEQHQLQQWLQQDEANEQTYEAIKLAWGQNRQGNSYRKTR